MDYKHVNTTLNIFYKWAKIGLISGQIKEKYGSIRWYTHISPVESLHGVLKAGHVYYRWCPLKHPVKDFLNNCSKYIFYLTPVRYITYKYKILIYNIAYRLALKASPGYEKEILSSCDWPEFIWGYEKIRDKYGDGWEKKC